MGVRYTNPLPFRGPTPRGGTACAPHFGVRYTAKHLTPLTVKTPFNSLQFLLHNNLGNPPFYLQRQYYQCNNKGKYRNTVIITHHASLYLQRQPAFVGQNKGGTRHFIIMLTTAPPSTYVLYSPYVLLPACPPHPLFLAYYVAIRQKV